MYELRGASLLRFLLAPVAGSQLFLTLGVAVLVLLASEMGWWWLWLAAPIWCAWIGWRTSKLSLRADATGIAIVNLVRPYVIPWQDVRGLFVGDGFHGFPATIRVERRKGRLWGVDALAALGLGRERQRAIALQIAELGREYGYGFPAGDTRDIEALHRAGLIDESDPGAHQAWWNAQDLHRSDPTN